MIAVFPLHSLQFSHPDVSDSLEGGFVVYYSEYYFRLPIKWFYNEACLGFCFFFFPHPDGWEPALFWACQGVVFRFP